VSREFFLERLGTLSEEALADIELAVLYTLDIR